MDTFDYVIVGSGAAGSLLAGRLSEGGKHTVCVLEGGPPDTSPWIRIPAGFMKTIFDPAVSTANAAALRAVLRGTVLRSAPFRRAFAALPLVAILAAHRKRL